MGSSNVDVKFDFVPWDGTPGDDYDSFQIRLMNNANKSATTVAGRLRTTFWALTKAVPLLARPLGL